VPTLVIHAQDDREVSADHARRYAGAGGHVRLYWADGLGHRRILADKGVVERAVGFVANREPLLLH
ncbi:alpha/beta hydrolase, partial [Mesorhizobium sp. M7A.F.Ca.CA.004.12.1.1]